ncbi:MAG: hypothetical protein ABL984_05350 [Pyrinomonadaceae bacterium]
MKAKDSVCLNCSLPICDELAEGCLYRVVTGTNVKARVKAAAVRDGIRKVNSLRSAIAAMGFKKYDGRCKPGTDPVQRLVWREQKKVRKVRNENATNL